MGCHIAVRACKTGMVSHHTFNYPDGVLENIINRMRREPDIMEFVLLYVVEDGSENVPVSLVKGT